MKEPTTMTLTMTPDIDAAPSQEGIDPASIFFTPGLLGHAERVGFTREQMERALAEPRWVNTVRRQPDPTNQSAPRLRYCGHGVAVIVEDTHAIAVIEDDLTKKPRRLVA
jgi:hypothetical protein